MRSIDRMGSFLHLTGKKSLYASERKFLSIPYKISEIKFSTQLPLQAKRSLKKFHVSSNFFLQMRENFCINLERKLILSSLAKNKQIVKKMRSFLQASPLDIPPHIRHLSNERCPCCHSYVTCIICLIRCSIIFYMKHQSV